MQAEFAAIDGHGRFNQDSLLKSERVTNEEKIQFLNNFNSATHLKDDNGNIQRLSCA